MFKITRRDLEHGYDVARRNLTRVSGDYDGERGSSVGRAVETAETMGSAFAMGALSGYFGPVKVGNTSIPVDLGVAAGLHLANILLDTGKLRPHLSNVANGVGAAWATKVGVGYGAKKRREAGKPDIQAAGEPQQFVAGDPYGPMTEAELMALATK